MDEYLSAVFTVLHISGQVIGIAVPMLIFGQCRDLGRDGIYPQITQITQMIRMEIKR